MYCPYCGVDYDEATADRSVEHIIPYGLGGSDKLTILCCKKCNNDLGSKIDAPFMESFIVSSKRFLLGLRSHNGNPVTLDLGGTANIDQKEVQFTHEISGNAKKFGIARPTVTKTPQGDGRELWQVFGDPAQVREIIERVVRKKVALGKELTLDDGTPLRLENLDSVVAEKKTSFVNPSVVKTIKHDYLDFHRFSANSPSEWAIFIWGNPSADLRWEIDCVRT
jgi:hypothetical protein